MDSSSPSQLVRKQLELRGWTQSDLAFALGTTAASVNQVLNDKRNITPATAKAIGAALGVDPLALMRLQTERDLAVAKEPDPIIAARGKILALYPLREMLKREWIPPRDKWTPHDLEQAVAGFFGKTSLDDVPHISHAAKRTLVEEIPAAQMAWLFRVKQIAEEMPTPAYSRTALADAVDQMKEYRVHREDIRHVPRLLSESGVRFVLVEGLPGSKIDGVCLWLNDSSPVIGMSLRFDRIDNFWFVLIHECTHVQHGHGRTAPIVDLDLGSPSSVESEEERLANTVAAEFCVPQTKMDSFYLRKNPFFSEKDVLAFSKILQLHPGLVVGQLQKRIQRYNFMRNQLVPVRALIEGDAMIDGWGHYVPVGKR